MTGKFTMFDEQRCIHYARFMRKLNLSQANAVFWLLFFFVLLLMCTSSIQHHKSNELEKRISAAQLNSRHNRRRVRKERFHMLSIVSLCLFASLTCVILECFALFNIQYCDGEDLMQLYWGFWSVLQVGSIIAILGVMLQFWIVLGNVETPSWAVALGTPVLVFAAFGWIFREIGKRAWHRFTGREMETEDDEDEDEEEKVGMDRWLSRAPTIVAERNEAGGVLAESLEAPNLRRHSTY